MNKIARVSWNEIKNSVQAVNPSLYQVIEIVSPGQNIPFYLAHFSFGAHFGIKNHAYLPTSEGRLEKIDSKYTENQLFQDLGYGKNSLPLGIILNKYCEWHQFSENEYIIPDCVQGPGAIFNMQVVFDEDQTIENNVLSVSSGALSSFLLPNIGCTRRHSRIQKYFNVNAPAPKSPYEHHLIFKEIFQDNTLRSDWSSQILYFSQEFINEVKTNDNWLKLKLYFSEALRKKLTQNTYDPACNELFLRAKKINRFRPTPFIIDTAKYVFNICFGSGIGVKPAIDDQYFPVTTIQKIYDECYQLEHTPTVMVPAPLFEKNDSVYYPLQCPFSKINTFKTNQSNSTLTELETLKNVLLAYQEEFIDENGDAYGSPLYHVSKQTEFFFYHYKAQGNHAIKDSAALVAADDRFSYIFNNSKKSFASDAKLLRGCVRLSR
ncbi:hypothetical protein [Legionella sp. km772]|uniref:hypothetical protein n=1 Tax=Legionella sp. km772 TaxID=2498111 RepID=UPI000F8C6210|nr:hypothetical protein [Legionella sp. km772]RUR09112.1 hypothetical protein ELY15_09625 [Legionella sp. km772]